MSRSRSCGGRAEARHNWPPDNSCPARYGSQCMAADEAATAAETLALLQTLVSSVQELSAASSLQEDKNNEFAQKLEELGEGRGRG